MTITKGNKDAADGKVGYKRPPRQSQYRPGQSGNPKGRPKKSISILEAISREADRTVQVKVGAAVRRLAKSEVLARRLFQLALEGDLAATRLILPVLAAGSEQSATAGSSLDLVLPDEDALDRIVERLSKKRRRRP